MHGSLRDRLIRVRLTATAETLRVEVSDPRGERQPVPRETEWGVVVEIERYPETARRLHAAEQAVSDPDPDVRDRAIREAGDIVRAAHREVAGG
ncbi:hypothetical protein [Streptomyces sp. 3214.6]|uniref:hypothetical protein n=1 Tax=Streptomyces sp. 3214.6 TaxID=1882757 RepID=UPI00090B4386|nr:hypothetical protein SAMN05444521_5802 [Streptomyces sp. 3214.6]